MMRPAAHHLQSLCLDVPEDLIREHLKRLDDDYFERFDVEQIAKHLEHLAALSEVHPVEVAMEIRPGGFVDCTIFSFDYPSVFSLISGVLCGSGASIVSGDVFTYAKAIERKSTIARKARGRPGSPAIRSPSLGFATSGSAASRHKRRRIIDHFLCQVDEGTLSEVWLDVIRQRFVDVLSLLERGDHDAISEAKQRVNELVTQRLVDEGAGSEPKLFPVEIEFDNDSGPFTRLTLVAQDTPAFLYSFSNALALQECSVEAIRIRTAHGKIRDEIDFVDASGRAVRDPEALQAIQLCVLLTKQFTYFLDRAPDPFRALSRFEQLVAQFLKVPENGEWITALAEPDLMEDLARLLGASDYLWEDFIRLQYESLVPILAPHIVSGERMSVPCEKFEETLQAELEAAETFPEKCDRLNAFKDRQIFLIDLDHILDDDVDFRKFSEELSLLAEVVVREASSIIYDELVRRHGQPRTVAGLEAGYAIFGLGKLGGCALGYASDIELLVVYGDNGDTDGSEEGQRSVSNGEFFAALTRELPKVIRAKREGIFEVDLRLRPYGTAGPMATSLEQFCRYYGTGGEAHSAERLALVRLRAVAGDAELGAKIERLRDEYLYFAHNVDAGELHDLRERQFAEKTGEGSYNAKFSPGALVDLEYTVQFLQVLSGKNHESLRTSSIHRALEGLRDIGVLETDEARRLSKAYDFLRRLINGLRMLRGSAKDLQLPPVDAEEFLHLARRMGYEPQGDLDARQQLRLEFDTRTAVVRSFVKRQSGVPALPGPPTGNAADLVLASDPTEELREKVLETYGFRNRDRAYANLRALAGEGTRQELFSALAVLAFDVLRSEPDPDMALNNWDRFLDAVPSAEEHYRWLLSQPRRLEILLGIFSRSQFLADTLICNPGFFDWVTTPVHLRKVRKRSSIEKELRGIAKDCFDHDSWLRALRAFRRREMLRIGTRDMCLRVPTEDVVQDLSTLAEAIVHVTLQQVWQRMLDADEVPAGAEDLPDRACLLAFGKLGGYELNYSSDIDLVCVFDETGASPETPKVASRVIESLLRDLSSPTVDGSVYRVDFRLRPWGGAGELVSSIDSIERYYREQARLWEIQALLKIRPIAGNQQVGYEFVERLRPLLIDERDRAEVTDSIERLRAEAVERSAKSRLSSGVDVKNGRGGVRDIEFLVQGLQLIHVAESPSLLSGNTLEALEALATCGILEDDLVKGLRKDYVFLRRVEHYLQILHDRQTHAIPRSEEEREALGRRVLGVGTSAAEFESELEERMVRVREAYETNLIQTT